MVLKMMDFVKTLYLLTMIENLLTVIQILNYSFIIRFNPISTLALSLKRSVRSHAPKTQTPMDWLQVRRHSRTDCEKGNPTLPYLPNQVALVRSHFRSTTFAHGPARHRVVVWWCEEHYSMDLPLP